MRNNRRADAIIDPVEVPTLLIMLPKRFGAHANMVRLVNGEQPRFVPDADRAVTLERVNRNG
jgi:hypothetical protein